MLFFPFCFLFLAQVEFAALFGQFIMVGYGRKLGAFTRHVRRQGQRTWLVVLPPKLCPRARSSSWQHNIFRSKLCHDCGLLPPRTSTRPTIKLIYHQYSALLGMGRRNPFLVRWESVARSAFVCLFTIMKTFSNILCKVVAQEEKSSSSTKAALPRGVPGAGRMRASISCLGIAARYRFVICKPN